MNTSGWIRGMIAKNYESEDFLLFVGEGIERQLLEWDGNYAVNIMKLADYHFIVRLEETYYETVISERRIAELQATGPFALDAEIWNGLVQDGLSIVKGYGNYLDYVGL